MKNLFKSYYGRPTPKKWRKIGDALLAVSTVLAGYEIHDDNHVVAISALIVGVIGKFLTNFFADDKK